MFCFSLQELIEFVGEWIGSLQVYCFSLQVFWFSPPKLFGFVGGLFEFLVVSCFSLQELSECVGVS